MAKLVSVLCPYCARKNKLSPEVKSNESIATATKVTIDQDSDNEADGWSVAGIFRKFFHASPDSKLAVKLYGSKKSVVHEKKRQSKGGTRWMIHPCSHFRLFWDILIVVLLIFTLLVLPVSIAFYGEEQLQPDWLTVNTLVDILFISDIFLNFRTGIIVHNKQGEVILSPKKVALQYLRGWFIVDVVSSIPIDYVALIFTEGEVNLSVLKASRALRAVRFVKLLSLLKLLRISHVLRFLQSWEDIFHFAGGMLRILKLVALMILLAHWNACFQFLIPVIQEIPKDSWIAIHHLQNATVGEQYTWALFKAISHMLCIGFGRFPPQNVTEAWLTIISVLIGATFYALLVGNMSTLLLSIDAPGRLYREKLNQVEEYMRSRKLPQDLRVQVAEYYEHRFRRKFFNEECILAELSKGLKESIINHNCREFIHTVPFFQNASPQFVTAILTKLKFEVFLQGECIIREGSIGTKMYFILNGVVSVLNKDNIVETRLSDGSYFGEISLLTRGRQVATIRSDTICEMFSLSKKHFLYILKEYPKMKCALEIVALQRLSRLGRGKKPKPGTLSTLIPPPQIAKVPDSPPPEEAETVEEQATCRRKNISSKLERDTSNNPIVEQEQERTQTLQHASDRPHQILSLMQQITNSSQNHVPPPPTHSPRHSTQPTNRQQAADTSNSSELNDDHTVRECESRSSVTMFEKLCSVNLAEVPYDVSDVEEDSSSDESYT